MTRNERHNLLLIIKLIRTLPHVQQEYFWGRFTSNVAIKHRNRSPKTPAENSPIMRINNK